MQAAEGSISQKCEPNRSPHRLRDEAWHRSTSFCALVSTKPPSCGVNRKDWGALHSTTGKRTSLAHPWHTIVRHLTRQKIGSRSENLFPGRSLCLGRQVPAKTRRYMVDFKVVRIYRHTMHTHRHDNIYGRQSFCSACQADCAPITVSPFSLFA